LARALQTRGIEPARANSLAALIVSAYEGALIQARVAGSSEPLRDTSRTMLEIIRVSLPSPRT
jgi:TetR/AcrR family transcriptional repressor of lmrAB and yxaGH operons